MSPQTGPLIWSHDTGQQIACRGTCQLTITWMPKLKDIATVMILLSYFSRYRRRDVRTDSHVTTKLFLDRWVTKFSKVWGSTRAASAPRKM